MRRMNYNTAYISDYVRPLFVARALMFLRQSKIFECLGIQIDDDYINEAKKFPERTVAFDIDHESDEPSEKSYDHDYDDNNNSDESELSSNLIYDGDEENQYNQ